MTSENKGEKNCVAFMFLFEMQMSELKQQQLRSKNVSKQK